MIEEVGSIQVSGSSTSASAPQSQQSDEEALDQMLSIMQKEDFIKILMNKNDELAHLPPKFYDTTKSLVQKTGSSQKLAENLSKSLCLKLKTEGVKDSIHEGFEPIMCLEEIMVKYSKEAIDKLMESSRTQGFE